MILKYLNGTPKKINELLGFYENRAPHGELIGIPTHLVRSASRPLKAPKSIPGRREAVSTFGGNDKECSVGRNKHRSGIEMNNHDKS